MRLTRLKGIRGRLKAFSEVTADAGAAEHCAPATTTRTEKEVMQ